MTDGYSLIFIDVDGVLNSTLDNRQHPFVPELVERFARLCRETGATPVMSTAWRLKRESRRELMVQLLEHGVPMPLGCTPRIHGPRGNEVLWWLQQNTVNVFQDQDVGYGELREEEGEFTEAEYVLPARIRVRQFVVLDDRNFRTSVHGGHHRHLLVEGHFVHTDTRVGLTAEDAEEARLLLCPSSSSRGCAAGGCARCCLPLHSPLHQPRLGALQFCDTGCLNAHRVPFSFTEKENANSVD